ncbi:phosphocholine-specific phospholipase C [Ideonella sp. A 288]|uniref:phosphocholine-specific phospholipase C n=1 Tax=Ideonella sp. A 288 TaxID=1962181 RepID=UPI000B4A7585|nr:phospholipase C, phosphocholine-specific [Ideonella sp. A 288]
MSQTDRRHFLRTVASASGAAAALTTFPPAIQRALAVEANRRTRSIEDVEHIVILMQENRSFDHYFGTLQGVRGFGDRFPIPVANTTGLSGKTVFVQPNQSPGALPAAIAPFRLDTTKDFGVMRVEGTPHNWQNGQTAWDHGRMNAWPQSKGNHSMAYFGQADMPFQWSLANAFTICDAYHASMPAGTNSNRLFQWTGTNDPLRKGNGPATYNDYDWFDADYGDGGYTWTTYPERLQAAGISWQVYENMADNFTDNPLAGFKTFRDAWFQKPGYSQALRDRGVSTRDLDLLRADVLADKLPQVSWIVASAEGSEHPGPSSPAQGADYTSRVLDALTSNPAVWSKTVLFINFDENDGFFDHLPPPAAPSYTQWNANPALAKRAGDSTVDTTGEYHEHLLPFPGYFDNPAEQALLHRPYGLGPRVPMYVVSPWSKGGWVDSQVFDHTSVLRFVERRFEVKEPNISAWRRAVCGDLTSAFNFKDPDERAFFASLPATVALADKARALSGRKLPATPATLTLPTQERGVRPSRALPYDLQVHSRVTLAARREGRDDKERRTTGVSLSFANTGRAAAVFHVYDRLHLDQVPRRYTVEARKHLDGQWLPEASGAYDLWVLGPNGFHRHFTGGPVLGDAALQANPDVLIDHDGDDRELQITLVNRGPLPCQFRLVANAYFGSGAHAVQQVAARSEFKIRRSLEASAMWYDFSVQVVGLAGFSRRFAGRVETGRPLLSDPAMGGVPALADQWQVGKA